MTPEEEPSKPETSESSSGAVPKSRPRRGRRGGRGRRRPAADRAPGANPEAGAEDARPLSERESDAPHAEDGGPAERESAEGVRSEFSEHHAADAPGDDAQDEPQGESHGGDDEVRPFVDREQEPERGEESERRDEPPREPRQESSRQERSQRAPERAPRPARPPLPERRPIIPASPGAVTDAIEECNHIIASLKQVMDTMEEILETLELAEVQKNADEREIRALQQAMRQFDRRGSEPRGESSGPREQRDSRRQGRR